MHLSSLRNLVSPQELAPCIFMPVAGLHRAGPSACSW